VFYLKTPENGGIDQTGCISYSSACGTIDYVIKNIVNVSSESIVYMDSGRYTYGIASSDNTGNTGNNGYSNREFMLMGYIFGPSVKINDIYTYPEIYFNLNSGNAAFVFFANIIATFEHVKFYTGGSSNGGRWLIQSLFIYFYWLMNN
jgi:hypothetical protein